MVREIILGNGNILICIDKDAQIRDFYFPYVGQENHVSGNKHRIGFFVNNKFSWLSDSIWNKELKYKTDTLVSDIKAINNRDKISIFMNEIVHYKENIFIRKIKIRNEEEKEREIKIFINQHFHIEGANIGDTVYYHPTIHALINYKGKRYFLINGNSENKHFKEYATGVADSEGKEGTYIDAQDNGKLSNNPVEHGSVDSTIAFSLCIKPYSEKTIYYWITVGKKFKEVINLNNYVLKNKPETLLKETELHWRIWANKSKFAFKGLNKKVIDLFKRSLLIIKAQTDNSGAIIAANDSDTLYFKRDTYSYMWPRDGALVARSLDRASYKNITRKFFKFCNRIISDDGYLLHKYRPDRSFGSSWHPWVINNKTLLPIQEDETALVLDALWKRYQKYKEANFIKSVYKNLIKNAGDFIERHRVKRTKLPKESYDLWEQKLGVHTFTASTIYAGLKAAANFAKEFGTNKDVIKYENAAQEVKKAILKYLYDKEEKTFIKRIYTNEKNKVIKDKIIDVSSGYGIFEYDILDINDERVKNTMNKIIEKLTCTKGAGGIARYENDNYYQVNKNAGPNPWFISTLWVAEYYIKKATSEKELTSAIEIFELVANKALPSGVLSEQINPYTGEPLSVAPLTWSHAGFITAVVKYLKKIEFLNKKI